MGVHLLPSYLSPKGVSHILFIVSCLYPEEEFSDGEGPKDRKSEGCPLMLFAFDIFLISTHIYLCAFFFFFVFFDVWNHVSDETGNWAREKKKYAY